MTGYLRTGRVAAVGPRRLLADRIPRKRCLLRRACSTQSTQAAMRANPAAEHAVRLEVGRLDGPAILGVERAYLLAFFDRYRCGETEPLLAHAAGPFLA